MTSNGEVLNSWKEVAAYLGRGVRTVQRWELELGLPVRRPRGKTRSAVIAFKPELDRWLHEAPVEQSPGGHAEALVPAVYSGAAAIRERQCGLRESRELLISKMHVLRSRSHDLRARMAALKQEVDRSLTLAALNAERNGNVPGAIAVTPHNGNGGSNATGPRPAQKHQAIAN